MKTNTEYKKGDIIGDNIIFLELDSEDSHRAKFKCYCGIEFYSKIYNLKSKKTKSCGCLRKQRLFERTGIKAVSLPPETLVLIEGEIAANDRPMRLIAERYKIPISRVSKIKQAYYERI